jgi:hypothetical protein
MPWDTKSEDREAQQRPHAVKMFRAGYKPTEIAIALQRSRRWCTTGSPTTATIPTPAFGRRRGRRTVVISK